MYPVKRKGLINSNNFRGMNEIAVPINTVLIVMMMGVTLFFEKVDNIKHKLLIVTITKDEVKNARTKRHKISSCPKNNSPIWKTARSPIPRRIQLVSKV